MEKKSLTNAAIIGASLLIGMFLLGFYIFKGLKTFSDKDRVVTVKGLAEMSMTAVSANISLSFSFSGDNLQEIMKQAEGKKKAIMDYLTSKSYNKNDITINNIEVTDRQKYYEISWQNDKQVKEKIDRYTIGQSLSVVSKDIKATESNMEQINLDLIAADLTCSIGTFYAFPDLNSIKPQLIAESTKNARIAGEQFAKDSQAKLGKIKKASQGQITIAGKYYDEETAAMDETDEKPYIQRARVVSTIVFFLE